MWLKEKVRPFTAFRREAAGSIPRVIHLNPEISKIIRIP